MPERGDRVESRIAISIRSGDLTSMGRPSEAVAKKLYALSGNRCAYPKCREPLVHEGTVTGQICHIKGARPSSPRYDSNQSDEARHGFENLILMCPIHHAVIDDDEIAYTIERLCALKADRETADSARLNLDDDQTLQLLTTLAVATDNARHATIYNQNVSSTNQSGGITAHTVNVRKPRRIMSSLLQQSMLRDFPREKQIVVWSISGDEETHSLGQQIFNFLKQNGFQLFGNGPSPNVFLGAPPRGVLFRLGNPCNEVIVGYPEGTEPPIRGAVG
jgi:hypothetical protein